MQALAQNLKTVSPVGWEEQGYYNPSDTLRYQIVFQKVGEDTAFGVTIRDTLDADLDTNTLHLSPASHPFTFTRNGLELVWDLQGINLPDSQSNEPGSHGFVAYSIQVKNTPCDQEFAPIYNTAHIYFDSNSVVTTNTVLNTATWWDPLIIMPGDVNTSGSISSADIIYLVDYVFRSQAAPLPCAANGDVNCSGAVTSSDIIYLVNYCFKGSWPPCDIVCSSPMAWTCN